MLCFQLHTQRTRVGRAARPGPSWLTTSSLVDPKPTSPWEQVRAGSTSSHRVDPGCKQLSLQRLLKLKRKQTVVVENWLGKASYTAGLHSSNTCSKTASTLLQHNVLPEAFQPRCCHPEGSRSFQTPWNNCTAREHRDQGHSALHPKEACSRNEEMLSSWRVPT